MSEKQVKQKNIAKKASDKIRKDNESGARVNLIEELFYDFHRSRRQVYLMNFFRGLFFGFGSVLGATILVALLIWLLGWFGGVFPPLADFLNNLTDTMQQRQRR